MLNLDVVLKVNNFIHRVIYIKRCKKNILKTTTKYISSKGGGKLCHKMLNPDAVPKVNNFISMVILHEM